MNYSGFTAQPTSSTRRPGAARNAGECRGRPLFEVVEASIAELRAALESGETSSAELTRA